MVLRFLQTLSGIIIQDQSDLNEQFPTLPQQLSRNFIMKISNNVAKTLENCQNIQELVSLFG